MSELLRTLARVGAVARLKDIEEERLTILKVFPDLTPEAPVESIKRGLKQAIVHAQRTDGPVKPARKAMPAWRRKQISKRMTAYWDRRRAERKGAEKR